MQHRFDQRQGLRPGSMMLALGLTAVPFAALILSSPIGQIIRTSGTLRTYTVLEPPPPDPIRLPPKPQPKAAPVEKVYVPPIPNTPVKTDPIIDFTPQIPTVPDPGLTPGTGETGLAGGGVGIPTPMPSPVFVGPQVDPKYQSLLQPPYPAEERRAGNAGRVVLEVLVGVDGRVKQVRKVSAASDGLFAAAQKQALGKWRFKPATKDGVPVEAWRTMSLNFVIED